MVTSIKYNNVPSQKLLVKADSILLGLYFFLSPFDQMLNFGYGTILKFIGIAFIAIRLISMLTSRITFKLSDPIIFSPILLIFISYLSTLWSIDVEETLKMNFSYLVLQIMFLAVYLKNYNYREQYIIKQAILLGGVAISFFIIVLSPDLLFSGDRLVLDEEGDPNHFAGTLILPLLVSFGEIVQSKRKWIMLLFGSLLTLLLFTGSRGGMLSVALAISYFFLKNRKLKNVFFLILIIGLFIIIVDFILTNLIIERLWTDRGIFHDNTTDNSRTHIWLIIFSKIIPQMPILGFGSGCPQFAIAPYFGHQYTTHNTFISMILEFGILGIPVFIFFLWSIFKILVKEQDYSKISVFIAIIIVIFFLDAYHTKFFWNILMFCIISYKSLPIHNTMKPYKY